MGTVTRGPWTAPRYTDAEIDAALARIDQLKADAEATGLWQRLPIIRKTWLALRDTIERKRGE